MLRLMFVVVVWVGICNVNVVMLVRMRVVRCLCMVIFLF